jgi:hypothetical protein
MKVLPRFIRQSLRRSRLASQYLEVKSSYWVAQGFNQAQRLFEDVRISNGSERLTTDQAKGTLRGYFDSHQNGDGIFKWTHYFEMYERHLSRFVNSEVAICEIGIYSGGSLQMWKRYFGERCCVYGVDIEPACKSYEGNDVRVFIGDQADRLFWQKFRREVPSLDILIDDGGHEPAQQIVTLEETLPYLNPGGVYICEDIHGVPNGFARYASGLALSLNAALDFQANTDIDRAISVKASSFQACVRAVSVYPFAIVIERNDTPISELVAAKRGTSWQPYM